MNKACFVYDQGLRLVEANPAAEAWLAGLGRARSQAVGRSYREIWGPGGDKRFEEALLAVHCDRRTRPAVMRLPELGVEARFVLYAAGERGAAPRVLAICADQPGGGTSRRLPEPLRSIEQVPRAYGAALSRWQAPQTVGGTLQLPEIPSGLVKADPEQVLRDVCHRLRDGASFATLQMLPEDVRAAVMSRLPQEEMAALYCSLSASEASELLSDLSAPMTEQLLAALSPEQRRQMVQQLPHQMKAGLLDAWMPRYFKLMQVDEQLGLLGTMPVEEARRVLAGMDLERLATLFAQAGMPARTVIVAAVLPDLLVRLWQLLQDADLRAALVAVAVLQQRIGLVCSLDADGRAAVLSSLSQEDHAEVVAGMADHTRRAMMDTMGDEGIADLYRGQDTSELRGEMRSLISREQQSAMFLVMEAEAATELLLALAL